MPPNCKSASVKIMQNLLRILMFTAHPVMGQRKTRERQYLKCISLAQD